MTSLKKYAVTRHFVLLEIGFIYSITLSNKQWEGQDLLWAMVLPFPIDLLPIFLYNWGFN